MSRYLIAAALVGALLVAGTPLYADDIFADGLEAGHTLRWSTVVTGFGDCADPAIVDDMEDDDLGICQDPVRYGS